MATYELRYFFDHGSGTCLWSANEAARTAFGYPVDLDELTVPPGLKELALGLLDRYDRSLDCDDPAGPPRWSPRERDRFLADSHTFLQMLGAHLGDDFRIEYERNRARPAAVANPAVSFTGTATP